LARLLNGFGWLSLNLGAFGIGSSGQPNNQIFGSSGHPNNQIWRFGFFWFHSDQPENSQRRSLCSIAFHLMTDGSTWRKQRQLSQLYRSQHPWYSCILIVWW
jgi:hypothetical protein